MRGLSQPSSILRTHAPLHPVLHSNRPIASLRFGVLAEVNSETDFVALMLDRTSRGEGRNSPRLVRESERAAERSKRNPKGIHPQ